ncbi:MAG: bacterial Ig-like domain-containing protein [Clostridia bacterium]|nr:bacterial Ig-like domain-containing protein [Clostridia bacterium]
MKKKVLWTLILILTACVLLLAAGCVTTDNSSTAEKTPKSLLVTQKHEGNYIIGEDIDLSEIKFVVNYSDKTTESVTLTDIMISEKDRQKFFVVGVHTINISYLGLTTPLQIAVSEK